MVSFNPFLYVDAHCDFLLDGCTCLSFLQCRTHSGTNRQYEKNDSKKVCSSLPHTSSKAFLFFGLTAADALELPDSALPLVSSAPSMAVLFCPRPRHSGWLLETIAAGSCWLSLPLFSSRLDPACSVLFLSAPHWIGSSSLWLSCPPMSPFTYQQRSKFSHSDSVLSHLSHPYLSPSQTLCGGQVNALPLVIMCPSASRVSPHIQYITSIVFL